MMTFKKDMKILFVTLTRHDEPLGIMYLSSILKRHGHEVRGIMIEKEDVFEVTKKFRPDLIGYSAMICEKNKILEINSELKRENDFFSIIGGPLATFSPEIIENKDVNALCVGEAEEALLELVENLERGGDIKHIRNIFVKIDREIYKNELRPLIENLDSIPFPDRTIFKNFKEGGLYNVITSRGCPFNCTYCHNKKYKEIYEGKGSIVRYRSIDNVIEEIKEIVRDCNPLIFWFQEDHFYSKLDVLKEFAIKYTKEINKPFICSLRPEVLTDEEVIKTLKDANCISVFTGCEAGNDEIRRGILKREISKEQINKAAELSKKYGIKIVFQNMLGIPTGNFESDLETLEVNVQAKPYYSWASICTPYPGTELYSIAEENGLIKENYENELQETYHFKSSLNIDYADKVNILHKIFAVVVEYPELLPIVKQPDFYKNTDDNKIKELKKIFDVFKEYKYKKLENPEEELPKMVTEFVEKILKENGKMKKALITGITGQDGSYLAEFLIEKGYEVHGIIRRTSTFNRERIEYLLKEDVSSGYTGEDKGRLKLHYGDLTDSSSIEKIIKMVQPDEVYNLAAQSQVRVSFDIPENTANVVALGTLRLLEAVKNVCPNTKFYQASSSEMFGKVVESPQTERTPFYPRSPYGCAKVFAHNITRNYREAYGLHASNGILFNHESEKRGENFVTKKITKSLANIKLGLQKSLFLGNLDAERDWGHAKDYVRAMWMILQQDKPDDYVIGTGEKHSVREFLEETAKYLELDIHSNGESGVNEKYLDENGNVVVEIHPRYFRPSEVDVLLADYTKARVKLGWDPEIKFKDIIKIMADYDLKLAEEKAYLNMKDKLNQNYNFSKKIMYNGEVIAIVFKRKGEDNIGTGINFLTEPSNSLQVGILNHPRGHVISSHIHHKVERKIDETQEMLYVEKGKMKVLFLTENNEKIDEDILEKGDLVILMRKGHGMEMLEDCKIIYVKQGPYVDKELDKKVFE